MLISYSLYYLFEYGTSTGKGKLIAGKNKLTADKKKLTLLVWAHCCRYISASQS